MKTPRISITDDLISGLLTRVAPLVERQTGWNLELPSLNLKAIPQDRGYEEIVQARLRSTGIQVNEDSPRFILERLVEWVLEANIYSAYDPGTQTILVVRENVDESNLSGLMVILAHELVHRGQHIHHPEIFNRADNVMREVYSDLVSNPENADYTLMMSKIQTMQSTMALIESHATYVEWQIRQTYFPDAQIETHFNLMSLLFRLVGGAKISQYTERLPEIAQASAFGQIDRLYQ